MLDIQPVKSESCLNLNLCPIYFFNQHQEYQYHSKKKYDWCISLNIKAVWTHQEGHKMLQRWTLTQILWQSVKLISAHFDKVDKIAITEEILWVPIGHKFTKVKGLSPKNSDYRCKISLHLINIVFLHWYFCLHVVSLFRSGKSPQHVSHSSCTSNREWHHLSLSGQGQWFHPHICAET